MDSFVLESGIAPKGSPRYCAQIVFLARLLEGLGSEDAFLRDVARQQLAELYLLFSHDAPVKIGEREDYLSAFLIEAVSTANAGNSWSIELHHLARSLSDVRSNMPSFDDQARARAEVVAKEEQRLEAQFLERKMLEVAWYEEGRWRLAIEEKKSEMLAKALLSACADPINAELRARAFKYIAENREQLPVSLLSLVEIRQRISAIPLQKRPVGEVIWMIAALVGACWIEDINRDSALAREVLGEIETCASSFPEGELEPVLTSARAFFAET